MKFLKLKQKKYFQITVVNFNNWNRIFERCMHILRFELGMPFNDNLTLTLYSKLRFIYPPEEINCTSNFSERDELRWADKFLASSLSFLIDTDD